MTILTVANIHFDKTGTTRLEHILYEGDYVIRAQGKAFRVPVGPTSNRPPNAEGLIRYNTDVHRFEYFDIRGWNSINFSDIDYISDTANNAFDKANDSGTVAVSAFDKANAALANALPNTTATLEGSLFVKGSLSALGATIISNTLTTNGTITTNGSLITGGSITTNNALTVNGAITTNGTITAVGSITTNGTITATGSINSSGRVSDSNGDVRIIPVYKLYPSGSPGGYINYTIQKSDIGKYIDINFGDISVPYGVFTPGDCVSIYNNSNSTIVISGNGVFSVNTTNVTVKTLTSGYRADLFCLRSSNLQIMPVIPSTIKPGIDPNYVLQAFSSNTSSLTVRTGDGPATRINLSSAVAFSNIAITNGSYILVGNSRANVVNGAFASSTQLNVSPQISGNLDGAILKILKPEWIANSNLKIANGDSILVNGIVANVVNNSLNAMGEFKKGKPDEDDALSNTMLIFPSIPVDNSGSSLQVFKPAWLQNCNIALSNGTSIAINGVYSNISNIWGQRSSTIFLRTPVQNGLLQTNLAVKVATYTPTVYLSGTGSTTNLRYLRQRGLATILCVGANTFVVTGSGVS